MSPKSEAQRRATEKYDKANYDSVLVRLRKGKKEQIKQTGQSLNGFITAAVDEKLERDGDGPHR